MIGIFGAMFKNVLTIKQSLKADNADLIKRLRKNTSNNSM